MARIPRPPGYRGLMEAMAHRLGADLNLALDEGELHDPTVERMMQHCSACGAEAACRRFLFTSAARISQAPDYCTNARLLGDLAERQHAREPEEEDRG